MTESRDAAGLTALAAYIRQHADEALPLKQLAARGGRSPTPMQRRFVARFGVSPKAMQDEARLRRFKRGLRQDKDVTTAIVEAGFGSPSRVYGEAARNLGMTPSAYRRGGAGERIEYAQRATVLGVLLMAATARGVCFAQFGDDAASLLQGLREEFPQAELLPAQPHAAELDAWMQALDAHLAQQAPAPDVPLDLRGTAFQIRVWRFLLGLAPGQVVSYGELAQGIGAPRAVRAAASACAANRIAVLVPCHRVVRGDGGLGGYRWGLERKRALLDGERGTQRGRR
jgi:AraC family transcriptional regulator of adaptative response/methylated-DNA-[protein]-cysteine methyltransferase